MYGAIIGDVVGSVYEFDNIRTKDFPLFVEESTFTDDTVMTVAVASALVMSRRDGADFKTALVDEMQRLGHLFPDRGYGGRFSYWLTSRDPKPYNSFGNGSAMRVSPCGLIAKSLDEALELAEQSAVVTHNHPEGIKGAQATAAAIYLARTGASIDEIGAHIRENYYELNETIDELRSYYEFDETCQGSVPQAIIAFLESTSYEDTIRNAISIGGDCDTTGAIAGAIAWAYYGRGGITPEMAEIKARIVLPVELTSIIEDFEKLLRGE